MAVWFSIDLSKEMDFCKTMDYYNLINSGVAKLVPNYRFLCAKGIYKRIRFIDLYIWIYLGLISISTSG